MRVKLKYYFLCSVMVNSVCLVGMELSDKEHQNKTRDNDYAVYAELLHDRIDEEHLWVESTTPFRRFFGSLFSYIYSHCLTQEEVKDEMKQIVSYIELENKEAVLNNLAERHWYIYYLMQFLVAEKCKEIKKEFEAVKGSNIDTLHSFVGNEKSLQSKVHKDALNLFYWQAGVNKSLYESEFADDFDNIHTTVLYGHEQEINPASLVVSWGGKYLRSTDCNNQQILWDMEQGVKLNLADEQSKRLAITTKWTVGFWVNNKQYAVIDTTDKYYAINAKSIVKNGKNYSAEDEYFTDYINNIPVKIQKNKPAIILFKRPDETSLYCQKAFNNSKWNREELFALKNSERFKKVTGFPKKNLEHLLRQRLIDDKYLVDKK